MTPESSQTLDEQIWGGSVSFSHSPPCPIWELKLSAFFSWGFPGGASGKEPSCQRERHDIGVQFLGQKDPLEEGMATHSNILSWRILETEEPGGLQSKVTKSRTGLKQLSTQAFYFCPGLNSCAFPSLFCILQVAQGLGLPQNLEVSRIS